MQIILGEFDEKFLGLSWDWLNDKEIKRLTDTADFTKEQQKEWYRCLRYKSDYLIWGIYADSVPIGACGLKNITATDCEYWGYIGNKQFWGKGIGGRVMELVEGRARLLNKSSLWLRVIKENLRAVSLYRRAGYQYEFEVGSSFIMRKSL